MVEKARDPNAADATSSLVGLILNSDNAALSPHDSLLLEAVPL
jgi:hypothetical protein